MSESTEHKSVAEQPIYIVWVLLLTGSLCLLDFAIPVGIYRLIYGIPQLSDLATVPVNDYSNAALWKGRIWYEVLRLRVGPNNLTNMATLTSFDPEKGDLKESKFQVPFPATGILAQGDRLWVVSPNLLTRIEGDESVEFKPKRLLGRTSEPFLYEDQIAIIDMSAKPVPMLLLFKEGEWTDFGRINIPFSFATGNVNGKPALIPVNLSTASTVGTSMMDLKVVSDNGRLHLFISEGAVVAYREGLELAPVSALAPENVTSHVDLSNLAEWSAVCPTPPITGRGRKTEWKAGILKGEPIVITTSSAVINPFQNTSLVAYRRRDSEWQKFAEQSTPALMNMMAVSDGQTMYVAGQSFAQTLRLHQVTETEIRRTGTVLKAPVGAFQEPFQRLIRLYQWVYWPSLLILAMGLSRLMSAYLDSQYQFGLTTVELASITRRGFARLIDMLVFWIPNYMLAIAFGMGSQEQAAENMDKFFDADSGGFMVRIAWLLLSVVVSMLLFLVLNSVLQGWWGITLGKWICGIRTVRSTLRPCGFPRAFFRELLLVADTLFGMTLLPVTLTIAFSSHRQRIGDMMADTIVIRKLNSNPPNRNQETDPKIDEIQQR
jgi:uncharacterized RDD family membrane protein YckC